MGAEVRQFPGCSGVSGGVGGRASGGAAGHDTTKRRDVSRAPRYRPQPRDTVVVVVVVVLLLIIILAGARLDTERPTTTDRPRDRRREEKGGFSIVLSIFAGILDRGAGRGGSKEDGALRARVSLARVSVAER